MGVMAFHCFTYGILYCFPAGKLSAMRNKNERKLKDSLYYSQTLYAYIKLIFLDLKLNRLSNFSFKKWKHLKNVFFRSLGGASRKLHERRKEGMLVKIGLFYLDEILQGCPFTYSVQRGRSDELHFLSLKKSLKYRENASKSQFLGMALLCSKFLEEF